MFTFQLMLSSCTQPINEQTITGTWIIEELKLPLQSDEENEKWIAVNSVMTMSSLRENDKWNFNDDLTLNHEGEIAIWPRPRTYQIMADKLVFYLGDIKESPDMEPLIEFTIIQSSNDNIVLRAGNQNDEMHWEAVLKRI